MQIGRVLMKQVPQVRCRFMRSCERQQHGRIIRSALPQLTGAEGFTAAKRSGLTALRIIFVGWPEAGRLFEYIQKSSRAIDSVALRIAHPFYDPCAFQSFDGALRGRKRDRQLVCRAFCRDEGICPQELDYAQRVIARFSGCFPLPLCKQSVD